MIEEYLGDKSQIREISLFHHDGSVNEEARAIIEHTLNVRTKYTTIPSETDKEARPAFLSTEETDLWFEKMKTQPPSEQRFLIAQRPTDALTREENNYHDLIKVVHSAFNESAKDTYPLEELVDHPYVKEMQQHFYGEVKGKQPTIVDAIVASGHNLFNYFEDKKSQKPMRMIPSLGMVSTFTKINMGDHALNIGVRFQVRNPVLTNRNEQLAEIREVAVRNPYQPLPIRADYQFYAPHLEFTVHDLYHVVTSSYVPKNFRTILIAMGDVLQHYLAPSVLTDRLYDMEGSIFEKNASLGSQYTPDHLSKEEKYRRKFFEYFVSQIKTLYLHQWLDQLGDNSAKESKIQTMEANRMLMRHGPQGELRDALKEIFARLFLMKGSLGKRADLSIETLLTLKKCMFESIFELLSSKPLFDTQQELNDACEEYCEKYGAIYSHLFKIAKEAEKELAEGLHSDWRPIKAIDLAI